VSSLGKELSTCLETARKLLVEKRTRDIDLFQKTKQLELVETNLKRATDQQSETAQRLESCLLERTQLNEEVSDLSTQLNTLASKVDKQTNEIESKKNELEKADNKIFEADLAVKTAKVRVCAELNWAYGFADPLTNANPLLPSLLYMLVTIVWN